MLNERKQVGGMKANDRKMIAKKRQPAKRSDRVRARRVNSPQVPSKGERKASRPPRDPMPPVMVRSGYAPLAGGKTRRNRKAVKRRYDIALDAPGVEIQLPAVPAVRLGWRVFSLIMVIALSVLLYSLWTSPTYRVEMVEVEGTIHLSPQDIHAAINVYNKPVFALDPDEMALALKERYCDILSDISVQVALPAKVVVSVSERYPMIEWIQGSEVRWVDGHGYWFHPRGEADKLVSVQARGLPEPSPVAGESGEICKPLMGVSPQMMSPDMVNAILALRSHAPVDTPLVYDPEHGLGWHDPGGWEVYFGTKIDDIDTKLKVYQSVVAYLQAEKIRPALVNMEHVNAPFYRLEQ